MGFVSMPARLDQSLVGKIGDRYGVGIFVRSLCIEWPERRIYGSI